ncbi:MAG: PilZ domain-containing protein [Candidatus Omnitrophota bacterium]
MLDKRNYRRLNLENNILLKLESDPNKIIEGRLLDISFVGLCIFLKEGVNIDEIVQAIVQFDVSGFTEQHFTGRGKIVYAKPDRLYAQKGFRAGLAFIEVNKEMVLDILNRLELEIIEQAKRKSQTSPNNPELF